MPGTLLEWENTWLLTLAVSSRALILTCSYLSRRRGIEARRKSVAPVGAWFSQVGRLHEVHHMWQYPLVPARFSLSVVLRLSSNV